MISKYRCSSDLSHSVQAPQGEAHGGLSSQQASEKVVGWSGEPAEEDARARRTLQNAGAKRALRVHRSQTPWQKGLTLHQHPVLSGHTAKLHFPKQQPLQLAGARS